MNRRHVLRTLVGAGLMAGIPGCSVLTGGSRRRVDARDNRTTGRKSRTATTTTTPSTTARLRAAYGDRFDEVVNVVDEGADPSGSTPIDDVLEDVVATDRLVYFPTGDYLLEGVAMSGHENVGLLTRPADGARIVPASPVTESGPLLLRLLDVRDLLFEGFTFDFRGAGRGGLVQVLANGDFRARALDIRGRLPRSANAFQFEVVDDDGRGLVENLTAPDGGYENGDSVGIYVGEEHAGRLVFRDCLVASFPNNGLYASTPGSSDGGGGVVTVEGGVYRNNNIANVRLGTGGSAVRNVRVVMDRRPPSHPNGLNARGIRIRRNGEQLVTNCRIDIGPDAGRGYGGIVLHDDAVAATVRDTHVTVDRDEMAAINVFAPSDPGQRAGTATFERVRVDGTAARGTAAVVRGRDRTAFYDCTVCQSGSDRNGIAFESADNCRVSDSTIAVTGTPIVRQDATIETANLSYSDPGVCHSGE